MSGECTFPEALREAAKAYEAGPAISCLLRNAAARIEYLEIELKKAKDEAKGNWSTVEDIACGMTVDMATQTQQKS